MKLVDKIKVDNLPDNCIDCRFNMLKYCPVLMVTEGAGTAFVQNNVDRRDECCPLISSQEVIK